MYYCCKIDPTERPSSREIVDFLTGARGDKMQRNLFLFFLSRIPLSAIQAKHQPLVLLFFYCCFVATNNAIFELDKSYANKTIISDQTNQSIKKKVKRTKNKKYKNQKEKQTNLFSFHSSLSVFSEKQANKLTREKQIIIIKNHHHHHYHHHHHHHHRFSSLTGKTISQPPAAT